MHAVMMTSTPSLLYWQPGTLEILHSVHRWRNDGLAVYFTIDAGPNVHLICEAKDAAAVAACLSSIPVVKQAITCRPGPAPQPLVEHLF
jgi:diphosphomevalonate decarboxylase